MKVLFQEKFFSPDLGMIQPGVREVPDDWEDMLPRSAEVVPDNTEVTPDDEEQAPAEPTSLRSLARLTAQEGADLRKENKTLKGRLTKQKNRIDKLEAAIIAAGIDPETGEKKD